METEEKIAIGILFRAAVRKLFAVRFRKEFSDQPFAEIKPVTSDTPASEKQTNDPKP